ncbi:UxaA family hydrolase [Conexibacter sp. CPCC 206217]|uniref:UxaA family hydrolase n=1 Tax=Conexibacter sp. CPCC 206217 TaxID=3064574 RepID=UPI002721079E|nr:UxaA family hydrolase [Conexibacter sp. CPCC 206217]MDO8211153.1 UxaA family hydrolase [Conexibacter sp. CPCC 206217]
MAETPVSERPRALVLDPADNVAVAVIALSAGEVVELEGGAVTLSEPIRFGHKLALRAIPAGEPVVKYNETIGRASTAIEPGTHVHVHNVVSARLPGPEVAAAAAAAAARAAGAEASS